jgi:hypothetical protein
VEGEFLEVGLPIYGVLLNSHHTWPTGIMLVEGKGKKKGQGRTWGFGEPTCRGRSEGRTGAEANTTRTGALVGAAMMVLPLVSRTP